MRIDLFAAEAGMPQLDPKYWASQAFWLILVFTILYISISKFFLPKIKDNLDNRDNKIKEDLDSANKFKEQSEIRLKEYLTILDNAKKDVTKIHLDSKNILIKDIQNKKDSIEKEIEREINKAQKEITELKNSSISSIQNISKDAASNIIERISGDRLNESSIKAAVSEVSEEGVVRVGHVVSKVRDTVQNALGYNRNAASLESALEELESAGILAESIHVDQSSLIANMNLVEIARVQASARLARASVQAALARQESRGCHHRSDFIDSSEEHLHHYTVNQKGEVKTLALRKSKTGNWILPPQ